MDEKAPNKENAAERVPNEREVLGIIEDIIKNDYKVLRSLEDEQGLYILEVETVDADGDIVLYRYTRVGKYLEGSSSETVVDVIFFSNGEPVGGHPVAKYIDGTWNINEQGKFPIESSVSNPEEISKEDFEKKRAEIAVSLGYEVEHNEGQWFELRKNGLKIYLKHFKVPSKFGYKKGRISLVEIRDEDQVVALWDRDGDSEIETIIPSDELKKIINELVSNFN